MPRPPKITPEVRAQIVRQSKAGDSARQIARDLGLSHPPVTAVLRAAQAAGELEGAMTPRGRPAEWAKKKAPNVEAGNAPPTLESQLGWLGALVDARRRDAEELRAKGDTVGAARATRDALSAAALLARHTPETETAGVTVTLEQMRAAAELGRQRLREGVERLAQERALAGACQACGRGAQGEASGDHQHSRQ